MFDMANYFYSESLIGTTKVCMYVRNLFFLKFEETTSVKAICGLTDFFIHRGSMIKYWCMEMTTPKCHNRDKNNGTLHP